MSGDPERARHGAFLPLLLLALTVLVAVAHRCSELLRDRDALQATWAGQQRQVDDSQKLRAALDALARDTAQLAGTGNPNAKLVVDELARRGVTIDPSAPSAAPATR